MAREVLGYHKLSDEGRRHFEAFFAVAKGLPVSDAQLWGDAKSLSARRRRHKT